VERTLSDWPKRYTVVALSFLALVIAYTDRVNISIAAIQMQQELGWSDATKGIVLSSFFIGYLLFLIIGGWLANRFGGKIVLGIAVVLWSAFTMLTPLAAAAGSMVLLLGARILLGIGEASASPAVLNLFSRWVPAHERARTVAFFSSGAIVGTLLALLITGWIIVEFGWPMAFYSFGIVGFVWAVGWYWLVKDDPQQHPSISDAERDLLAGIHPEEQHDKAIPWRRIFSHPAAWALIVANFSTNWGLYVALAWLPSYFYDTQGISLVGSGLYSMAPWLSMFFAMNIAGVIADKALQRGMDATRLRKIAQTIGLGGSALFLVAAGGASTPLVAVTTMCGALACLGVCYSGFVPAVLEMAPRYSDVLWGISNTFGTIPGIIGVAVTGWLVGASGSYFSAFALAAGIHILGVVVWAVYGTSKPVIYSSE
jgi:ACS family sodium-dependent inorganic phosphate cotransporter